VDIDPDSKRVFLADGTIVPYDSLIVAAGSQTSYFGHNDWQEWAPGLKSVEEAIVIRHKILYVFEVAERISDTKLAPLLAHIRHRWSRSYRGRTLRCHCRDRTPNPKRRVPLYQP
jgi:NADH dehydrogenase FAD-containing subunit